MPGCDIFGACSHIRLLFFLFLGPPSGGGGGSPPGPEDPPSVMQPEIFCDSIGNGWEMDFVCGPGGPGGGGGIEPGRT